MSKRAVKVLWIAALTGACIGCEETECRTPVVHAVDEERSCLEAGVEVPELRACTPWPPTRGSQVFCLVDASGQLYLASGGDSEQLSGEGWRYSGGTGASALSEAESEQCAAAVADFAPEGSVAPSALCDSGTEGAGGAGGERD